MTPKRVFCVVGVCLTAVTLVVVLGYDQRVSKRSVSPIDRSRALPAHGLTVRQLPAIDSARDNFQLKLYVGYGALALDKNAESKWLDPFLNLDAPAVKKKDVRHPVAVEHFINPPDEHNPDGDWWQITIVCSQTSRVSAGPIPSGTNWVHVGVVFINDCPNGKLPI